LYIDGAGRLEGAIDSVRKGVTVARAKVLLADDHTIVAQGLGAILKESFDLVGTVSDGRSLIDSAKQLKPDIIVTDISMPLLNGLDAIRKLKSEGVTARVIVLTMHSEAHLAAEAFGAGASGYVLKHAAGEELVSAIHEALRGRVYLTPLIAKDLITVLMEARNQPESQKFKLTPRQREVLQLVGEGRTMKEVAATLNISTRTAESHKYGIMEALGVQTTAELVQHAIRLGLISI
jgi:DNA-binding NarL/FixJ family response regulator